MNKSILSSVLFLFLCSLISNKSFSQNDAKNDKIILLNGKVKNCIVISATEERVVYKLNMNADEQSIASNQVFLVLDENNEELAFYGCSEESKAKNVSSNTSNNEGSFEKECEKKNTGDFTFTNNGSSQIKITLNYGGNGKPDDWRSIYINTGESQTFYDIPVGSHAYNGKRHAENTSFLDGDFFSGQVNVLKCKKPSQAVK